VHLLTQKISCAAPREAKINLQSLCTEVTAGYPKDALAQECSWTMGGCLPHFLPNLPLRGTKRKTTEDTADVDVVTLPHNFEDIVGLASALLAGRGDGCVFDVGETFDCRRSIIFLVSRHRSMSCCI